MAYVKQLRNEAEILQSNLPTLVKAISNPESIALELFSRNIISQEACEKVRHTTDTPCHKATSVLMLVLNALQLPGASQVFDKFLQVLKEQPSLIGVTRILEEERDALLIVRTDQVGAPSPVDEKQPLLVTQESSLPAEQLTFTGKPIKEQRKSPDSPVLAKPFQSLPSYHTASRILGPVSSIDASPGIDPLKYHNSNDGSTSISNSEINPLSPLSPYYNSPSDNLPGIHLPDGMLASDRPVIGTDLSSGQDMETLEREELSCVAVANFEASTSAHYRDDDDDGLIQYVKEQSLLDGDPSSKSTVTEPLKLPTLLPTPLIKKWQPYIPIDSNFPQHPPCSFLMGGFMQYLVNDDPWKSPYFYTHPEGYKMRLEVYGKGYGTSRGRYVSVFARLARGEFDDKLPWPFQASVTLELLNWKEDKNHVRKTIDFVAGLADEVCGKVCSSRDVAEAGISCHDFVSTSDLFSEGETTFLDDNRLCFRVCEVKVHSTNQEQEASLQTSSVVAEAYINDFEQKKNNSDVYYCKPFYSHFRGYKMRLEIHANGYEGSGGHIAIYARLLKGEFDGDLCWPFLGIIVIQLVNWHVSGDPFQRQLEFHRNLHDDISSRVTEGEKAKLTYGFPQFIAHSDLIDSTRDAQYLLDGCLGVVIKEVIVCSTPLVNKIPSWQDPTERWTHEFTLTMFSDRKRLSSDYYSLPFYSQYERGYKLCLSVDSDGYGSSKGSDISIFVHLMKGKNDDSLSWPFESEVVIKILNWRKDDEHIERRICFTKGTDEEHMQRVRDESSGATGRGWGKLCFCTYQDVACESVDKLYLQNDCLRIRVSKIESVVTKTT